ncbi:MAG: hypothetical protein AAGG81_04815 [Chlamydiota bacterium]
MLSINRPVEAVYHLPKELLAVNEPSRLKAKNIILQIQQNRDPIAILDLMDQCLNLGEEDEESKTILHWAALKFSQNPEMTTRILQKWIEIGLDVNQISSEGLTFINYMISSLTKCLESPLHLKNWVNQKKLFTEGNSSINANESLLSLIWKWTSFSVDLKIDFTDRLISFAEKEDQWKTFRWLLTMPFKEKVLVRLSVEDTMTMIRHYSKKVDMNTIFDDEDKPLIIQPMRKFKYYPISAMRIIKTMIECGAKTNITDPHGRSILLYSLEALPLCIEETIQFITYLINNRFSPFKVTEHQKGYIHHIQCSLDDVLSTEQQKFLFVKLYKKKIVQEFRYRQLLVNLFDLSGYQTKIFNEVMPLEGSYSLQKFYNHPLLTQENSQFYLNLRVSNKKEPPISLWPKVLKKFMSMCEKEVSVTVIEKISEISVALEKIPNMLNSCFRIESKVYNHFHEILSSEEPCGFMVRHLNHRPGFDHVVAYYNHGEHILIGNRGYGSGKCPGVTVHKKSEISQKDSLCSDLFYGVETTKFTNRYFPERMISQKGCRGKKIVHYIQETTQSGHTCPIASYESLELSMVFMTIDNMLKNRKTSTKLAQAICKIHHSLRRQFVLSTYLSYHEQEKSNKLPVDTHLLLVLRSTKTSDLESDQKRYQQLTNWLTKKNPSLAVILSKP